MILHDLNPYQWSDVHAAGYGGTSVIPEDAEQGPAKQRLGFDVPKRQDKPKETRLEFIGRRVGEIRSRGYTKSDEVNLLADWCAELLELVDKAKTTPTGAAP